MTIPTIILTKTIKYGSKWRELAAGGNLANGGSTNQFWMLAHAHRQLDARR